MDIARAQQHMRHAYFGGAPGMAVSALVWAVAAGIAAGDAFDHAVWALFIGGMAIHPLGMLVAKMLGRPGSAKGNPFDRLAFECTITMIAVLPLAYAVSVFKPNWFFPAMLLIIGGRYMVFATVYGLRLYWACGGLLVVAAWGAAFAHLAPPVAAGVGAAIEAVFAALLFARVRGEAALPAGAGPA